MVEPLAQSRAQAIPQIRAGPSIHAASEASPLLIENQVAKGAQKHPLGFVELNQIERGPQTGIERLAMMIH